jgi:hypothetical protein
MPSSMIRDLEIEHFYFYYHKSNKTNTPYYKMVADTGHGITNAYFFKGDMVNILGADPINEYFAKVDEGLLYFYKQL